MVSRHQLIDVKRGDGPSPTTARNRLQIKWTDNPKSYGPASKCSSSTVICSDVDSRMISMALLYQLETRRNMCKIADFTQVQIISRNQCTFKNIFDDKPILSSWRVCKDKLKSSDALSVWTDLSTISDIEIRHISGKAQFCIEDQRGNARELRVDKLLEEWVCKPCTVILHRLSNDILLHQHKGNV